jgi:hypothetical protein
MVRGGQQPIAGATIQLYTVGVTGDGSPSTPLLTQTVQSDASGSFTLTNLYSCSSATEVYITATGGNPGASFSNPNISLMTALGPCSALTPSTFINIDELTTVAAISALAPYTSSLTSIGSAPADANALSAAFTLAGTYVNPATGFAPGSNVPAGDAVPVAELNTLADVVSACVNSAGGVAGDTTPCGQFFTFTALPNAAAPTDTVSALLNLARNPSLSTAGLFNLVNALAPFQPQLSVTPPDFLIRLTAPANPAANLTLSTSTLNFGSVALGSTAPTQTVILSNSTASPISLSSVVVTGANPRDFSASSCPASLAPSASCSVQISASPTAAGTRSGYLTITSPTPGSPQYVALSVNGTGSVGAAAQVSLSSNALNFVFPSGPIPITLTNAGGTPLLLQAITLTGGFTETDNCGAMLFAQSICTITVTPPSGIGPYSGSLTLADNDSTAPQTATLTVDPTSWFAASIFYFGNVAVGSQGGGTLQLVSNKGGTGGIDLYATAMISSPAFFGLPPNGTSCVGNTQQPPPNNCELQIAFKPPTAGPSYGSLAFTTYSASSSSSLATTLYSLAGVGNNSNGAAAFFTPVSPIATTENSPSTVTLTLNNTGSTTLQFGSAASFSTNSKQAVVSGSTCTSLAPSAGCNVTVTYTAGSGGLTQYFIVSATDLTSGEQFSTTVQANTRYQPISANPSSLTFPATHIGSTAPAQTVTVANPDSHPLNAALYNGSPSGDFQFTPASCSNASCVFNVTFAPVANANLGSGSEGTTLNVTDSVSHQVLSIGLTGTRGLATLTVNPTTLNFITRPVGTTSVAQTVTIANSGDGNATVNISLPSGPTAGSGTSDFIYSGPASTIVSPGSPITLSYSFAPTGTGVRNATATITNAQDGSTLATINLIGTAQ